MAEHWIPIVLFVVSGVIALGYFYWNNKNKQTVMETVQKSLDQGQHLTPELLASLGATVNPRARDLRRGIVFLSLGLGGMLSSLFFTDGDIVTGMRAGSMFPLMLGFGFLLVWKLNQKAD
jgi:hypothetical protein